MRWKKVPALALLPWLLAVSPANASVQVELGVEVDVPSWARGPLSYAVEHGYIRKPDFRPKAPMGRADFTQIMRKAFGGGFSKNRKWVTAGEVDAALVRALGYDGLARALSAATSPDGWDPSVGSRFGTEVVARELGLRYNHLAGEERLEANADETMIQADVLYAVWKAKTSPATWAADQLATFRLPNYTKAQRRIVSFAFDQVGSPYVWGGEWATKTPAGYPYGAQPTGGFDCSGFSWYVLRESASGWNPPGRGYRGWSLPQRSSSDMAQVPRSQRVGFKKLRPADLMLFAPKGRRAKASTVYHAGIYLGRGWMIDSSGSQAGVSLSYVGTGSWWRDQFAWGRRIVKG